MEDLSEWRWRRGCSNLHFFVLKTDLFYCIYLYYEYLGEGAVTEPLGSEYGEGGTLPSLGRKYLR